MTDEPLLSEPPELPYIPDVPGPDPFLVASLTSVARLHRVAGDYVMTDAELAEYTATVWTSGRRQGQADLRVPEPPPFRPLDEPDDA